MSQVQVLFNFKARAITSYLSPQKIILAKKKGANCDFSPTPENTAKSSYFLGKKKFVDYFFCNIFFPDDSETPLWHVEPVL